MLPIHTLELSPQYLSLGQNPRTGAALAAIMMRILPYRTTVAYADALCILGRRRSCVRGLRMHCFVLGTLQLVPEEVALPLRRSAHTASGIRFRA